jgi:hypothetical protein
MERKWVKIISAAPIAPNLCSDAPIQYRDLGLGRSKLSRQGVPEHRSARASSSWAGPGTFLLQLFFYSFVSIFSFKKIDLKKSGFKQKRQSDFWKKLYFKIFIQKKLFKF